ncbi:hypothetical protein phiA829_107 [Aeromonas phage phiA8-29]|uniref:Uncharacterized protein n=1 Tax=Aeromonas phage phiA8-29 TaxID=1978922 RepID=A0A1W6DY37_9CAUD|nr:hypothetical protein HWB15_gp170 [Aeromonas phage phiA8-29]ARK07927.1 hypothetical protein phiA829_107 [Aeromonas phage phiA8-29]
MAAFEISVKDWSDFLADETLDIEIEGPLLEDPLGQEIDYLDEDFYSYLSKDAVLKLHDGVVVDYTNDQDTVCLKKYVKNWLDKRQEVVEEQAKKPNIYISFQDENTMKKVREFLSSLKNNFNITMEIQEGDSK